jgi:Glucose-regulated metallo-peptidase M90
MQLSRLLALPLVLIAAIGAYLAFQVNTDYAGMIVPCAIGLGLLFVLSPQIDWWWYQRHPPKIAPKLQQFLESHSGFFRSLQSEEERNRFRERAVLFKIATDFKTPGEESDPVTEDVKMVIAATAVQLSFYRLEFLLPKFENVVVFNGSFISPQYPQYQHSSELYEPDGVLLFSAPHVMKGFMQPQQYYDVCLHEWARAFLLSYPNEPWPSDEAVHWEQLSLISGFPAQAIAQWINRPDVELLPAAITLYFQFPERFRAGLPKFTAQLDGIFRPTAVNLS